MKKARRLSRSSPAATPIWKLRKKPSDQFKYDEWIAAFGDCGLDPHFYACRERSRDELLPWAFIDAGVTQRYLWRERERALQGVTTPDCRQDCQGCGMQRMAESCKKHMGEAGAR